MRIELFGLCGAGKTYLTNEIIRLYPSIGLQLPVQPKRYAVYFEAIRLITRVHYPIPWLTMKLAYRIAGLKMRSISGVSIMVDSGVLQPIVSAFNEHFGSIDMKDKHSLIGSVMAAIPMPDMAVYIKSNPLTAHHRYKARGQKVCPKLIGFSNANQVCWEIAYRLQIPIQEIDNEDEGISELQREAIHDIITKAEEINSGRLPSAEKV